MVITSQGSILTEELILSQSKSKSMEAYIKKQEDQSRKLQEILEGDSFCLSVNIGPNVNLKIPKKSQHTLQEKEYFKKKIKITKKTELCKNWELYQSCYFKDNCSFAHGENELRVKNNSNNNKFKTKMCKAFAEKKWCQFGNRCQYRHVFDCPKIISYNYLSKKLADSVLFEIDKEGENYDFSQILNNYYMYNNLEKYL
jgi:hypothetical protein